MDLCVVRFEIQVLQQQVDTLVLGMVNRSLQVFE